MDSVARAKPIEASSTTRAPRQFSQTMAPVSFLCILLILREWSLEPERLALPKRKHEPWPEKAI
jgi:hypothetical protein